MESPVLCAEATVLRTHPRPGVTQLTLNRPGKLNVFDESMYRTFHDALEVVHHDTECRAVVLTGAGRGFCAGGDMQQFASSLVAARAGDLDPLWNRLRYCADIIPAIRRLPQPVVVAVNGVAVGGGLCLTAAADIRFAAAGTQFAAAGQRVGLSAAEMGISYLLPRLVGFGRAQELMLTGRSFTAEEALEYGLLARVLPAEELLDAALDTAQHLADGPTFATRVTKEALWDSLETSSLRVGMDLENRHTAMLMLGREHQEGVSAFLAGRKPVYRV